MCLILVGYNICTAPALSVGNWPVSTTRGSHWQLSTRLLSVELTHQKWKFQEEKLSRGTSVEECSLRSRVVMSWSPARAMTA